MTNAQVEAIAKRAKADDQLYHYNGEDRVVDCHNLREQLVKERRTVKPMRCNPAFPTLDELINGFTPGEMTTISGPTKNGKTLLAQSLTETFAAQDIYGLWFTYEVPSLQFLDQFGERLPSFCMPSTLQGCSLDWLRNRVREARLKYGIQYVMIDHLHFLVDMKTRQNMSLEIGHVMRSLKKMAVEHEIALFIIAHTGKVYGAEELDNESIRDSSFVAQESDNVFLVWRNTDHDNQATLKVSANRRMGIYGKKVYLVKIGPYFREMTEQKTLAEKDKASKQRRYKDLDSETYEPF
jgi:replicative DNA helicase